MSRQSKPTTINKGQYLYCPRREPIPNNGVNGISLDGAKVDSNKILSNYIGTNKEASKNAEPALGNGGAGVRILNGATNNVVKENVIVFNQGAGVNPAGAGAKNRIQDPNLIFGNGGLGIDLTGTGVPLAHDPDDADTGANNLQNYPVLTSATVSGSITRVTGTIDSLAGNSVYPIIVEFFDNTTPDPSGYGEGEIYLGSLTVTGPGPFTVDLPGAASYISATATDDEGNTSEFSQIILAVPPTLAINDVTLNEGNAGTTSYTFTVTLSAAAGSAITVDYATEDGSALAGSDYAATTGTLTFNPGQTSKTITLSVVGDTMPEGHETFSVGLFNAVGATIVDPQGLGSIRNDDTAITIMDVTQNEGAGGTTACNFMVMLSHASDLTVAVDFATADGTASAPGDYASAGGTLAFNPGEIVKSITINVVGDLIYEPTESFTVNLSNAVNALVADGQAIGTISNDDAQPAIAINDVAMMEGNTGTTNFVFTVTLSNPSAQAVTVNYATANGTAMAPGDYTAASGTLTFNPGEVSKTITIAVVADTVFESNETFVINLSGASGATIADAQGQGTIQNDDVQQPSLSINDVTMMEGQAGITYFTFTVSLSWGQRPDRDRQFRDGRRHGHRDRQRLLRQQRHAYLQPRRTAKDRHHPGSGKFDPGTDGELLRQPERRRQCLAV